MNKTIFPACRLLLPALLLLTTAECTKPNDSNSDKSQAPQESGPNFERKTAEEEIFSKHKKRLQIYASPEMLRYYRNKRRGNTVAIQHSHRKRLYDHNILLRALFQGRLIHNSLGNLKDVFTKPLFFDIGSAVVKFEGAPTVRDIQEDPDVFNHLLQIVASDINDYSSPKTQFINIYKSKKEKLPFAVQEIDMSITEPAQVRSMLEKYLPNDSTSVILRAVNTGPDFFYPEIALEKHFRAILIALEKRSLLYLFHNHVLLKPAGRRQFQLIGHIPDLFMTEKAGAHQRVNWSKRTIQDSFQPDLSYVRIIYLH